MNLEAIENFRKRMGKRADKALEVLGKLDAELLMIFETEIGRRLLEEDVKRFEQLLYQAALSEPTPEDRAEFKYILNRLTSIKEKVNFYLSELAKIGD